MKTISRTWYAAAIISAIIPVCMLMNVLFGTFYGSRCLDPVAFGSPMCSGALALMTIATTTYSYTTYIGMCSIGLGVVGLISSILG